MCIRDRAGTAVKIRNADTGEWVVQHLNYPSPIDIDTFVTDSTGTLMLPQPLPFGNYELFEQQSQWGDVYKRQPLHRTASLGSHGIGV